MEAGCRPGCRARSTCHGVGGGGVSPERHQLALHLGVRAGDHDDPARAFLPRDERLVAQVREAREAAPLFGVDGTVIMSHGAATSRALVSAIELAVRMARRGLTPALTSALAANDPLFVALRG